MRISDWSSDVCSSDLLAGGGALDRDGYFVAPTVVRDLPDTARLVREEQFGPAIPVLAYDTIEDVISRANDSEYVLGGTIWNNEAERGPHVALQIQSGTGWDNGSAPWRERVCEYVEISVVAGITKKKHKKY